MKPSEMHGGAVKDSPVGAGTVTAVTPAGYPEVNGVAVAWVELEGGEVFDPNGVRLKHLQRRRQEAEEAEEARKTHAVMEMLGLAGAKPPRPPATYVITAVVRRRGAIGAPYTQAFRVAADPDAAHGDPHGMLAAAHPDWELFHVTGFLPETVLVTRIPAPPDRPAQPVFTAWPVAGGWALDEGEGDRDGPPVFVPAEDFARGYEPLGEPSLLALYREANLRVNWADVAREAGVEPPLAVTGRGPWREETAETPRGFLLAAALRVDDVLTAADVVVSFDPIRRVTGVRVRKQEKPS